MVSDSAQYVFNKIAAGWYGFRHHTIFRRELEAMAQRWQKGKLLNIGCGHGPDFIPFKDSFELHGCDFSIEMLRLGQKYGLKYGFNPQLVLADIRYLPYCDETFAQAIAVASYHHLKGENEVLAALSELKRVLKPGGEAFITVWNRGQPRFWFSRREAQVPWHSGKTIFYRYYYLFTYREIEKLVRLAGLELLKSFPESNYHLPIKHFARNICLLTRKP